MANIREIIERVDDIKPNAFTEKTKLAWIGELEGLITADVMLMATPDICQMECKYPDALDRELLVGFPHDGIYEQYLCAKIDFANGEYSKYQNSMEMFNANYENFVNWFIRTYSPGQGYREENYYGNA